MQAQDFTVQLDNFSGPLDVLLNLIQKAELDICDISLSKVTGGYIKYIQTHSIDPTEYNWFLDIATKLILAKSSVLIEGNSTDEEDAEDLQILSEQLRILSYYKDLASKLSDLSSDSLMTRQSISTSSGEFSNLNMEDLVEYYNRSQEDKPLDEKKTIRLKRRTDKELRKVLLSRLKDLQSIDSTKIASLGENNQERVVIFMLILELIKSSKAQLGSNGTVEVLV